MTLAIRDVRESLVAAVRTTGLPCSDTILDVKNPPCAQVYRKDYDPRMVFAEGKSMYEFGVVVFMGRVVPESSFAALDLYAEVAGPKSITAALQNEANWTFDVDYVQVVNIGGEQIMEVAGTQYLTIEFDVEVVG